MRSSAVHKLLWAVLLSYACTACAQQLTGSGVNATDHKAVKDTNRQGECTPGSRARCCSPQGTLLQNGTVCRTAASVCEEDQTCNGVDATCPAKQKADGTECAYDPLEYWYRARGKRQQRHGASSAGAQDLFTSLDDETDDDGDYDRPPYCIGECFAGRCTLDKSKPGCCTLQRAEQEYTSQDATYYASKAATQAEIKEVEETQGGQPAQQATLQGTGRGEVYCWEGSDYHSSHDDY